MFGSKKRKAGGIVGLDIGSSSLKAVELKQSGGRYELASVAMERLNQDTIVDGAIMDSLSVSSAIEKLFSENRIVTSNVATSVSGHSVIVKRVTMAAATEEELEAAIQREAIQHIRFDLAEVNLSYYVLGPAPAGNGLDVLLLAVKREKLENHTGVLGQANKTPLVLDIDA
ncbi:MAG: pilus assembly protein PilM, partial [Acidobacteriota bacterium]|nr:pilus assembly protein PilM [Acidobacteriota bacterium]